MTKSESMEDELSRRERQIMDVLFSRGEASAAEVREGIPDPPGYTACRTLLKILEDKGYVQHREDGRRYLYSPRPSARQAGLSALTRVLDVFFGGSIEQAVVAHLNDPDVEIDAAELRRLRALLNPPRKK